METNLSVEINDGKLTSSVILLSYSSGSKLLFPLRPAGGAVLTRARPIYRWADIIGRY